jgi:medium-chain acyl-[acyl-carrier-protein] hydrolase
VSAAGGTTSLLRLGVRAAPRRRLFCLPYAGGGVATYRLWHKSLPDDIEVVAAQLAGREARLREAPVTSIAAMVDAVLPAIMNASDLPYALFGHSMGALVAYELAGVLEAQGVRAPSHLFVSARRPPDEPDPRPPVHAMPEAAFLDEVQRRYGAIPAAVLEERELMDLLLPTLRADLQAVETYAPRAGMDRIACPVHVYGGDLDTHPHPAQLPAWDRAAAGPVRVRVFPGDHFYINTQRDALLADVAAQWQASMAGAVSA